MRVGRLQSDREHSSSESLTASSAETKGTDKNPGTETMAGEDRFIITARIIGAVHKAAPKLKTFMVSVAWSDGTELIIYRSFEDFQKFHRDLKKKFPTLNPFRKNKRVIPKFRGKARKSSMTQKGSKRSVLRMKFLESYCDKLFKCEQDVTRSSEVTFFFLPKEQDLQSDFTNNSIMILMADTHDGSPDGVGAKGSFSGQQGGNITHPFITLTYRCIAAYETKDTKNRPFNVDVDENVDVLIKDPAGWWLVENEEKRLAWFPAPYLELLDGEDDDEGFQPGGSLYCAVRTYSTKNADEVSVSIGSVVEVLKKSDNGWWLIRSNGKVGYVPCMYLKPYNNPRVGIFNLQRKMHSSTLNLSSTPTREPQVSYSPTISEETDPLRDPAARYGGGPAAPGRIHKAQSLDVLSETWPQARPERAASAPDGRKYSVSGDSSISDFSSASGSSQSLSLNLSPVSTNPSPTLAPGTSRQATASPSSSVSDQSDAESLRSKSSDRAPRVPPRPRAEEILNSCTTMTRKAALATKDLLKNQMFEDAMAQDLHQNQSVEIHVF